MSFASQRAAALSLLTDHATMLNRKAGQFLGQLVVHSAPMSVAQSGWLSALLEQAGLPPQSDSGWGGQAP